MTEKAAEAPALPKSEEERLQELSELAAAGHKIDAAIWRVDDFGQKRHHSDLPGLAAGSILGIHALVRRRAGGGKFAVTFRVGGKFSWTYAFQIDGAEIEPAVENEGSDEDDDEQDQEDDDRDDEDEDEPPRAVLSEGRTPRELELERQLAEIRQRDHDRELAAELEAKFNAKLAAALEGVAPAGKTAVAVDPRIEALERQLTETQKALTDQLKAAEDARKVAERKLEEKKFDDLRNELLTRQDRILDALAKVEHRIRKKPKPVADPLQDLKELALVVKQNDFLEAVKERAGDSKSKFLDRALERFVEKAEKPLLQVIGNVGEKVGDAAQAMQRQADAAATPEGKERLAFLELVTGMLAKNPHAAKDQTFVREHLPRFGGQLRTLAASSTREQLLEAVEKTTGEEARKDLATWEAVAIQNTLVVVGWLRETLAAIDGGNGSAPTPAKT